MISVERTILEKLMNVWITATANYNLTYGFEELLDE